MNTFAQWLHQHSFIVVVCFLLVGSYFLITWFRRWTRRTFVIWLGCLVFSVVVVLSLRTPAVTVSELVSDSAVDNSIAKSNMMNTAASANRPLDFSSIQDIERYLGSGGKPTLVEFYSDFGFG